MGWGAPALGLTLACAALGSTARAQGTVDSSTPVPAQTAPTSRTNAPANGTQNATTPARLPGYDEGKALSTQKPASVAGASTANLLAWRGLKIAAIRFEGVPESRLAPLPSQLALQPNAPLDPDQIKAALRRLYATGLYRTIAVEGTRNGDTVTLVFRGEAQMFIGRVTVVGVKQESLENVLESQTKLSSGTPYTPDKLQRAQKLIRQTLQNNGFFSPSVQASTVSDDQNAQVNIDIDVKTGKQARVGDVAVEGDSGLSIDKFRKKAKLKRKTKVTRDTVQTALKSLKTQYQKQQLLEATATLDSQKFQPATNTLDYTFKVNRGPKVVVDVQGVKMSKGQLHNLVPVFEEGAVDEDLLNEGNKRIHDLYQRKGYFNVQVTHDKATTTATETHVVYHVDLGKLHSVDAVTIHGNTYFSSDLITPRLT